MNLNLTEQQANWRARAAAFAAEALSPRWENFEADDRLVETVSAQARSAGLLDAYLPEEAGGHGLDLATMVLIVEELARGEGGVALLLVNRYACYRAACLSSNADFKRKVVDSLVRSESGVSTVWLGPETDEASTFEEKGSNASSKQLCVTGEVTLARSDTMAFVGYGAASGSGERRAVGFFLSKSAHDKKVQLWPVENFGLRSLSFNRVSFEKGIDDADAVFELREAEPTQLQAERDLLSAALILGIATASFEYALSYSRERVTFGKPINQHQAIALKLADMSIAIESARLMLWEAATASTLRAGEQEGAMSAWMYAQEVAIEVAIQAVQTLGGHGYLKLHPVEKLMRDIQFLRLLHGTHNPANGD